MATMTVSEVAQNPANVLQELVGVWIKDKAASDSMDPVCRLMELNWAMRTAVSLIKGVEIKLDPSFFMLHVLPITGLGWFKIKEKYPWTGEEVQCSRRDMRRGHHLGRVSVTPTGSLLLHARWDDPRAGTFEEHIYLASPRVLHVDTVMTVSGESVQYRTVYHKA